MFSKILVPLDCSTLAEQVLPTVTTLAKGLKSTVQLLCVIQQLPDEFSGADSVDPRALMEGWRLQAENYLSDVARQLTQNDFAVSHVVGQGDVATGVILEAQQQDDTLIAISTHGWEGDARWNLGSVTRKILQSATSAVLVVRAGSDGAGGPDQPLERIIVPLDGSDFAEHCLPYAVALANITGARLSLLRVTASVWNYYSHMDHSVVHTGDLSRAARDRATEYLHRMTERLESEGMTGIEQHVEQGEPAGAIIDLSDQTPHSMVVMVTHGEGSGGHRRRTLGSVAQRVAGGSQRSVLVIPPEG
jgi:nucleotide-binding universal stress UspA family protein